jgi:iron complex outermembrane receptor protein
VYVGSRYFSTVNEPSLLAPSYVTGNASVGYTSPSGKWNSTLSVENVNNKAYQTYKIEFASTAGYGEENFAPPRWVSWQLRYNF